ncbi:MAG: ATP-binding cassette domain-containing protein [Gammaproteobacteria bacterium]|nr:ATP-binding cassette domain-containing protein [Gammaproteobacteria bacterium]
MSHLLELKGVSKRFGGVQAVVNMDLHADLGEILGVIGPNGAGKTTLFNIVTGFYRPDSGKIRFDGHNVVGFKPNQVARIGIARTFQAVRLFANMTVIENAMVGQHTRTKSGVFGAILNTKRTIREEQRITDNARQALGFFGDRLTPRLNQLASELAYADRRRLEIARAMATEPKMLLLDEPAAGMNPAEKDGLIDLIGRLRDEMGYAIVLIEHDMPVIKGVCDRVIALDYGKKIAEGTYEEVAANQQVIEAYLGKAASEAQT